MNLVNINKAALFASVILLFSFSTPAFASDSTVSTSSPSSGFKNFRQDIKTDLSGLRTKACQVRMDNIKNRSTALNNRGKNMEQSFSSILTRIEDYYTNKLVPAGITIPNYDALVSAVNDKKAALDTAVANANAALPSADCTDTATAKAQVAAYRTAMQQVIAALKDYREAIKNLLMAIKAVAGKGLHPSPSASPTV